MLALLLAAVTANSGYVRSRTTDDPQSHCLWWRGPQVVFQQSVVGNPLITGLSGFTSVSNSVASWGVAMQECGNLSVVEGDRTQSRRVGTGSKNDVNTILFRLASCKKKVAATHPCWKAGTCANDQDCWDHTAGLLGVTTVTYDVDTGEVHDADIELNAADNYFTTVDLPVCTVRPAQTCVAIDVQNTLTHELGHALGLAHSERPTSTMNALASPGETSKRALDPGTHLFVCEVYPRDGLPQDCTGQPIPPPADAGTGTTEPPKGCSTTAAVPLLLSALAWVLRRRGLVLGALLLFAMPVQATTLFELDVETMTSLSEVVVHARVARVMSRWSDDGARIITEVELVPIETWKGAVKSRVIVTQPGGVVGHIGQRVDGVARFAPGDETVVFLEARGPAFTVTGLLQGRFAVEAGTDGPVVSQQGAGQTRFVDRSGVEVVHTPTRLLLSSLRARVRAVTTR